MEIQCKTTQATHFEYICTTLGSCSALFFSWVEIDLENLKENICVAVFKDHCV